VAQVGTGNRSHAGGALISPNRTFLSDMKSTLVPLLLFVSALGIASAASTDGLSAITARKTLRIGVADFAPWTYTNLENKLEGFEIDLGRQLAHDLEAEPVYRLASLPELFAALERGEIDLVAAGLAITPARAREVDFSLPYFETGTTLVAKSAVAGDARRVDAFNRKGLTVVVVADTFSAGLAAQLFDATEIRTVPDRPAAEAELTSGRAQLWLTNLPDARIAVRTHPETLALPLDVPLVRSVSGLAVKRGNQALLNYLNAWIAARLADNFIPTLTNYWFSDYEWTRRVKPSTP